MLVPRDIVEFLSGRLPEEKLDRLTESLQRRPEAVAELEALADQERWLFAATARLDDAELERAHNPLHNVFSRIRKKVEAAAASAALGETPEFNPNNQTAPRNPTVSASTVALPNGPASSEPSQETFDSAEAFDNSDALRVGVARIPRDFGRYRIRKVLGRGGMGVVFLADDTKLERLVALKTPLFPSAGFDSIFERFKVEAKSVAALDHPNICSVYDYGEFDGQPYITMRYIRGQTLHDLLDGGRAPLSATLACGIKVADALQHAHDHGVIHRDLKPSNILIDEQGRPVVTDFGLARRDCADSELTESGQVLGTPAYSAPEQLAARRSEISRQSDIFSLGALLYKALTGRSPWQEDQTRSGVRVPVPPPSKHREDLSPIVDRLIMKALEHDPKRRYASMTEFARAMREAFSQLEEGRIDDDLDRVSSAWKDAPIAFGSSVNCDAVTQAVEQNSRFRSFFGGRKMYGLAAFVLLPLLFLASEFWVRVETKYGKIVIEGYAPDVVVKLNGERVTVNRGDDEEIASLRAIKIGPDYMLELTRPGFTGYVEQFQSFDADGEKLVRVEWQPEEGGDLREQGPDQRAVVERLLRSGGAVSLGVDDVALLRSVDDLPAGEIRPVRLDYQSVAKIDPDDFRNACKIPTLRRLHMGASGLNDALAAELRHCKNLDRLWLNVTAITDRGLSRPLHLHGLRHLDLSHSRITERGFSAFQESTGLLYLDLSNTDVSDEITSSLTPLKELEILIIHNTVLTDKSVSALSQLTTLVQLDVRGTQISDEGMKKLRASLPRCKRLLGPAD